MASTTWDLVGKKQPTEKVKKATIVEEVTEDLKIASKLREIMPDTKLDKEQTMTGGEKQDDTYINTPEVGDDFDFVMAYDDDPAAGDERLLADNSAPSAINCGFIGVGGGGGRL